MAALECQQGAKKILQVQSGPRLTESIVDGLVQLYPDHLGRLDDNAMEAGVRVIVRRDFDVAVKRQAKVAVISGGGSGHEPAHAGFVGKALLTAAVCGDVFSSPTAKAILCAIVTVSCREAGCVLIVKNYTGDRLNFGIAAETARSRFGIPVETVYVKDDVALQDSSQPRGLAGCVLVHKVAGAAADRGWSLEEVARTARVMSARVKTMGAAYEVCALPGQSRSTRLACDEIELGLGIHGEPGVEIVRPVPRAETLAERLVMQCASHLAIEVDMNARVALVVNNLGATSGLEMAVFSAASIAACRRRGLNVVRCLEGALVTSIDMHGVSISLAKLADEADAASLPDSLINLLDHECDSPYLKTGALRSLNANPVVLPADVRALQDAQPVDEDWSPPDDRIAVALKAACQVLNANEPLLTEIDSVVGDGDCGTTLKQGAQAVEADMTQRPVVYSRPVSAVGAIGDVVSASMGGSSGALYMLGARAAETALRQHHGSECWPRAFVAMARAISMYGGANVGSRTMCDAILPAAEVLEHGGSLNDAAVAARRGAESTKTMVATHGRSAYLGASRQAGIPDPGAIAAALILEAVANALNPAST